jgi:hypothetical protein
LSANTGMLANAMEQVVIQICSNFIGFPLVTGVKTRP